LVGVRNGDDGVMVKSRAILKTGLKGNETKFISGVLPDETKFGGRF
jgi:hypothetical protein